jgi:hypothetical protein
MSEEKNDAPMLDAAMRDAVVRHLAGLITGDACPQCEADKQFLENLARAANLAKRRSATPNNE